MTEKKDVVLLGAGPCGLAAAWYLQNHGCTSFHLYEVTDHAGGLSSSVIDANGFTWDIGGHVFHNADPTVDALFSYVTKNKFTTYMRRAFVQIQNTFVSYPFQYALFQLPPALQKACIEGVTTSKKIPSPTSFYDWILQTFGFGMATYFFFPYNRKMWNYPLEKMGWEWTSKKVATAKEQEKGTAWGSNAQFFIPNVGGMGSVFSSMAAALQQNISYHKQAVAIDGKKHIVTFSDGSSVSYGVLFSTIPLTSLTIMTKGIRLPKATTLASTGVIAIGIGIKGTVPELLKTVHWIYVPDPKIPFFRVSVYSNYGTHNAPSGAWSLLFELSYDGKTPVKKDVVIRQVITTAMACGYIPKDADIVDRFYIEAPLAYPVPTKNRDAILSRVTPILEAHDIFPRGRFGSWKYEEGNMDHVMLAGIAWAHAYMKKHV